MLSFKIFNQCSKYITIALFSLSMLLLESPTVVLAQPGFQSQQLQHGRVSRAYGAQDYDLRREFQSRNLVYPPQAIFLRAFKKEGTFSSTLALQITCVSQHFIKTDPSACFVQSLRISISLISLFALSFDLIEFSSLF